nr:DUF4249 domain-containing protein [Saprospiraceae bacterium]
SGDGYFAWEYSSRGSSKIIVDQGGWISDEFLDGHLLADLSIGNAYAGQEAVVLEVHSLGKEAVDYFTQLDEARYREGIFDPPPFDIPTNLSNGAVGFFVVSAVFQEKVLIDN